MSNDKQQTENTHTMSVSELLGETLPGFMEAMMVPMNGKAGYNISRNWKFVQDAQKEVIEANNAELRKHVITDPDGSPRLTVKDGENRPTPDYLSDESKKAYFDWYKNYIEETSVTVKYFPVDVSELQSINGIKPATLTSLAYMFHE